MGRRRSKSNLGGGLGRGRRRGGGEHRFFEILWGRVWDRVEVEDLKIRRRKEGLDRRYNYNSRQPGERVPKINRGYSWSNDPIHGKEVWQRIWKMKGRK